MSNRNPIAALFARNSRPSSELEDSTPTEAPRLDDVIKERDALLAENRRLREGRESTTGREKLDQTLSAIHTTFDRMHKDIGEMSESTNSMGTMAIDILVALKTKECREKAQQAEQEAERLRAELSAAQAIQSGPAIRGELFAKLMRTIEAFPATFPDRKPKIDAEVRPWLREKFECSTSEQRTFGTILGEHFNLRE